MQSHASKSLNSLSLFKTILTLLVLSSISSQSKQSLVPSGTIISGFVHSSLLQSFASRSSLTSLLSIYDTPTI